MIRILILTAGVLALGAWLKKSASATAALPVSDGPLLHAATALDGGRTGLADMERQRPAALEDGGPADRSSDAEVVRPGFADYARGA